MRMDGASGVIVKFPGMFRGQEASIAVPRSPVEVSNNGKGASIEGIPVQSSCASVNLLGGFRIAAAENVATRQ
jgi:hypothetical protein